jgi:hypothetical protein
MAEKLRVNPQSEDEISWLDTNLRDFHDFQRFFLNQKIKSSEIFTNA